MFLFITMASFMVVFTVGGGGSGEWDVSDEIMEANDHLPFGMQKNIYDSQVTARNQRAD